MLGEAFREVLPRRHRQALTEAAELLLDDWFLSSTSTADRDPGLGLLRDAGLHQHALLST